MADSIHFSVQVISRASGRSATAAAAYRSGTRIADERTGVVHDYRRKGGVVFSEVLLPSHAPSDFSDRSTLWNAVEQSEKGKNAQVCREIVAALPRELSRGENIAFARDYIRRTFVDAGMVADWAYHDPDGKNENPHIHVMLTMREVGEDGAFSPKAHKEYLCRIAGRKGSERYMTPAELKAAKDGWEKVFKYRKGNERRELTPTEAEDWKGCKKAHKDAIDRKVETNDWNDQGNVEKWREAYAWMQNQALDRAGLEKRVDHRSFERRGVERVPQVHLGPAARAMERRGVETVAGAKNRAIAELNGVVGRTDLSQDVKQDALEEAHAIRSMAAESPGEVRNRLHGFVVRAVERVREVATSAVQSRLPRLFQRHVPSAADIERRRAVQEAAERRRNAIALMRQRGPGRGPDLRNIADRAAEAFIASEEQTGRVVHRTRGGFDR